MSSDTQYSILVVDDEPLNLSIVSSLLEESGYEVLSARDGEKGLDIARNVRPDLILLDVMMPGIDGFEVCSELKKDRRTAEIPVIFLTALIDTDSKIHGFELGGVDYLEKPINEKELEIRVSTHIRIARMGRQLARHNDQLRQSERLFRAIFNSANVGVALLKPNGHFDRVNDRWVETFGYSEEMLKGKALWQLDYEKGEETAGAVSHLTKGDIQSFNQVKRFRRSDGELFWGEEGLSVLADEQGEIRALISVVTDLTEYRKSEEEMRLAATVFETAGESILVTDAKNRIVSVNRAFTRMTGYTKEEVLGQNPTLLASDRHGPEFFEEMWGQLQDGEDWQGEIWNRRKGGELYPQQTNISIVRNNEGEVANYVAVGIDIGKRKELEEILRKQAHFDPLTHLPNRMLFLDRLDVALQRGARRQGRLAVLYIDLDGFKPVNDTFGHDEGDRVLAHLGGLLNQCVRDEDTVARLGGDEFAILLTDLDSEERAIEVAERVLEKCRMQVEVEGVVLPITLSIGIAHYPRQGEERDRLLKLADMAMYQAKRGGKNRWAVL
jgi:diguanylate cyclase (GGDEF)-like protein/PAS domain S-box-containing protein